MEPPSPIQALEVNPFPSRFIILLEWLPEETLCANNGKSQSQRRKFGAIVLHQQQEIQC